MNDILLYFFSDWIFHCFSINDRCKNIKLNIVKIFFICCENSQCQHNSWYFEQKLIWVFLVVVILLFFLGDLDAQKCLDSFSKDVFCWFVCFVDENFNMWKLLCFDCDWFKHHVIVWICRFRFINWVNIDCSQLQWNYKYRKICIANLHD